MSDESAPAAERAPLRRQRGSWLFTPADDPRKLASAARSDADALIADLEDGVAPERKDAARELALEFAQEGGAPRIVRINDPRSEHGQADLERFAARAPLAVMVPKATMPTLALAHAAGLRTVALIETAEGLCEAERIATCEGVLAMALGTIDLAAELSLGELPGGLELLHARSRLVLACALSGIPAIDGVHPRVTDTDALAEEARRARALGFAAKLCIHPAQLAAVREAFTPSAAEIEHARGVLAAYEHSRAQRRGAALAGGEMVDLASVRRARRLLDD
ncbi:MAG TPA: CoA ester lyase [Solirubrobacteraceae bacterium]|nr:CoA ester lyase [Solirubrobacteraceae bacterium]